LKKGVKKEVETSEKIWGYIAGEGEFENRGKSPGGFKKGPKNFEKFFAKEYRRCVMKILTW